jgi:HNH endonuclease
MIERWTARDDALLRKMWPYAQMRSMVWVLRRTKSALKNRAHNLGLRNRYANRKPYTAVELRTLRKLFPHISTFKVAKRLKRSVCSVNGMATKFGLHKTEKYLASPDACRLRRGDNIGAAYRFPPGHVPANKGLRRPGYALTHGRMVETTFKKGQRPPNYDPVGTIKPNADGYLRIKLSDIPNNGKGANDKNWEFVHRRVWEAAHGPIPKGHRIWWKDGNHANCALENLELLSDKEHMARTTIHTLPPELKDTIMLAGRLKREIRRKTREAIEEATRGTQHHGTAQASV